MIIKSIRRRLKHRPNAARILDNIGWLFFDRGLRLGLGLVLSVWLARYLGPKQFGLLNYAIALVALFGALSTLGLQSVVVRELVRNPGATESIIVTALVLHFCASLVVVGLMIASVTWLSAGGGASRALVLIIGLTIIFQASMVAKYWFESRVQSRYVVWLENGIFIALAGAKIVLILVGAPLVAFAWAILLESVLLAVGLLVLYQRISGARLRWKASTERAMTLLRDSWPLALSGIAIMVYMRIDQVMLAEMIGPEATGIYSAAMRVSEVWYAIPMIIVASVFPAMIGLRDGNVALFRTRLQQLLTVLASLGLAIAVVFTFSAEWVIQSFFGDAYRASASVLKIHIWAGVFVFIGVAGSRWYLLESLQRLSFYRAAMGAIINVLLNFLLIPRYGVHGAASATVVSQVMSSYLFDLQSKKSVPLFLMKTRALCMAPVDLFILARHRLSER